MESRLLRWIACSDLSLLPDRFIEAKKPCPEKSTFAYWWQTIEDRVLLCVEEVARASTSRAISTASWCIDVPPVTSSQQFLNDPATHLRITTVFTTPFRLERALLLHTAPCPYRPTDAPVGASRAPQSDLGEGAVLAFVPRRWGSRRACGWRQPVPRRWCVERCTRSRKVRAAL